jgi:hypothetical protein
MRGLFTATDRDFLALSNSWYTPADPMSNCRRPPFVDKINRSCRLPAATPKEHLKEMPESDEKLSFLVDDVREVHAKGMLPGAGISSVGAKAVDISASAVTHNLASLLTRMLKAVSACPVENDAWTVDTVRFTVAVTSKGELSVVSVVRGEFDGQSGLEFTLKKRS